MTQAIGTKAIERSKRVFRILLVSILSVLIGSGFTLDYTNQALAKQAEQAPIASATETSPIATVTEPEPTPTTPATPDPVLAAIQARQTASGCNLHVDPAVAVKSLGTCKLLLVGDSLGNNLGYGMIPQLKGYKSLKFVLKAKASTGLSNSWFYNWETNLKSYLRTEKPNIVVVFLGANDRQNMKVGGQILTFGTSKWKTAYAASVARMTKMATDSGAYLLWVGLPNCKPYNYNKGMELISAIYAKTVPQNHGARYIELHNFTSDARGNYTQYQTVNGSRLKTRGDDGIHFTANGQNVIGTYAITKLATLFKVAIKSNYPRVVTE